MIVNPAVDIEQRRKNAKCLFCCITVLAVSGFTLTALSLSLNLSPILFWLGAVLFGSVFVIVLISIICGICKAREMQNRLINGQQNGYYPPQYLNPYPYNGVPYANAPQHQFFNPNTGLYEYGDNPDAVAAARRRDRMSDS